MVNGRGGLLEILRLRVSNRNSVAHNCAQLFWNCVKLRAIFRSLQGSQLRASKIHLRWKPYSFTSMGLFECFYSTLEIVINLAQQLFSCLGFIDAIYFLILYIMQLAFSFPRKALNFKQFILFIYFLLYDY